MLTFLCLFISIMIQAQGPSCERSLWVWSQSQYLGGSVATDAAEQENLFHFIQENQINRIYIESNRLFVTPKRVKALEVMINKSHQQHIKTELLFGSTEWLNVEKSIEIKTWFKTIVFPQVIKFKSVPEAIHLDIEPHARDDWSENKEILIDRWLSLVGYISSLAHEHGMKITVDIPFFMEDQTLIRLNELVDTVVVMSYRTKLSGRNSISSLTEEERAIFKSKLVIGLETGSSDPLLSFGQDSEKLSEVIMAINETFDLNVAVHHYESVKNLKLLAPFGKN